MPEPLIANSPQLSCYVKGWMEGADDFGFLALHNNKPIGAAWCRCWSGNQLGFGFIDNAIPELSISVMPSYRGYGVGRYLLRKTLVSAKKQYPAVSLSVSLDNPAKRLYEKEGFQDVGLVEQGYIKMVNRFSV
ncbi:GNAT family N-acetyltransferase [Psychrobium sp. 1_MG-2023]|uniref:GNAT family N-acetyltransferase n=1 Tax=Psychrobium sp. 1_MG-2023 TaxID=3062624 RepID=UPI000C3408AC|nr:GNAT family N-acetyltransferase [Psychrobium sp. 1_MG-2023]MDP2562448.1 GNAT family N-acetyltransferase [Psychrobium sp. 1_MG-2023]PKF56174.1 GNAT family N-acetyltransferase [Alteromonadales bacterium alter-6D02]